MIEKLKAEYENLKVQVDAVTDKGNSFVIDQNLKNTLWQIDWNLKNYSSDDEDQSDFLYTHETNKNSLVKQLRAITSNVPGDSQRAIFSTQAIQRDALSAVSDTVKGLIKDDSIKPS